MKLKMIFKTVVIAAIAAMTLGALSCTQIAEMDVAQERVSFSAATTYKNLPQTRTVYSGTEIDVSGQAVERIDWVANTDKVAIYNTTNEQSAIYSVGVPTAEGTISKAGLSFDSGDDLTWADGENTFLSIYPTTAFSASDKTFGGTLPAVQVQAESHTSTAGLTGSNTSETVTNPTMNGYAYMVAKKVTGKTETVTLDYSMAVTAFEFNVILSGSGTAPTISKFEMVSASTPLVGSFTWDGTAFTCPTELVTEGDNANNKITVNFDGTTPLSATTPLRFTVFALPQDIDDVTVTFYLSSGTKTLALKTGGAFDTFTACKKYRITTPGVPANSDWVYTLVEVDQAGTTLETHDPLVRASKTAGDDSKDFYSYRTNTTTGATEIVQVAYEFSPANADGTNLEQWSTTPPANFMGTPDITHVENSTEYPGDYRFRDQVHFQVIEGRVVITKDQTTEHKQILAARSGNEMTSDEPQDLALYDITNLGTKRSGMAAKPVTANCYVVDKKGWYMFPLVYGNAIDWYMAPSANGWNTAAYTDGSTVANSNTWMHGFENYNGAKISSPYILDDVNKGLDDVEAIIVWEDVAAADAFIEGATVVAAPVTTARYYEEQTGSTAKTVPYIKFQVNDKIRQGNALIALREKNNGPIIWSWHIWITDRTISTVQIDGRGTGDAPTSNQVMQFPIGWCDTIYEEATFYDARYCWMRIYQVDGDGNPVGDCEPIAFQIKQYDDPFSWWTPSCGTFYVWGRKDPYLPGAGRIDNIKGTEFNEDGTKTDRANVTIEPEASMEFFNKAAHSPAGLTITSGTAAIPTASAVNTASESIRNPHKLYTGTTHWMLENNGNDIYILNQWNANALSHPGEGISRPNYGDYKFHPAMDRKVVKTVYDPCPPDFSVPNYGAFTGMTENGNNVRYKKDGLQSGGEADSQWNEGTEYEYADGASKTKWEVVHDGSDYRFGHVTSGCSGFAFVFKDMNGHSLGVPGTGTRTPSGVESLNGWMAYHTAICKAVKFCVCFTEWGPVGNDQGKYGQSYNVLPVRQQRN